MNLGKLLEETYSALGAEARDFFPSTATGGTATTIVDTSLATLLAQNGLKKCIFFISQTTDGLSPQGKFGVLPAAHYVAATWTFTIPTVTDAVGAGDIYTIMKPIINLRQMISQVNLAMGKLPPVRLTNASLTAAADTKEYTLPVATKGYPIQEVWVGNATDGRQRKTDFTTDPAAGGSTETLRFFTQPDEGETIKLVYLGRQTALSIYSDAISEKYADELVLSACFLTALEYYMKKKGLMINRRWTPILEGAKERYNRASAENPVRNLPATRPRTYELGRL